MERSFEEEITVTGSLIPRADLTALSPVTVMDVQQELTYSGVNRIEDLVVTLPQVFAAQNATIANGASGIATIDLRHLGTARTLVLVNGRRLAPGDAVAGWCLYAPDIHQVPAALVKRVDVLTGGASTVYGSDAVAGVVNFVMDTDFEGFRGGLQYSFYHHDNNNATAQDINEERGFDAPTGSTTDGDAINAYFSLGGKFADGKGHAVAYATYRKIDAILKGDRDYTNCAVSAGSDGPVCGGSSTIAQGRFIAYNADGSFNGDYMLGNGNEFVPRAGTVFNYGPYNHLQRPDEKFTAGAFAHYTVNDHFEPYIEVMAMSNYTDAQIASTGTFFNTATPSTATTRCSRTSSATPSAAPAPAMARPTSPRSTSANATSRATRAPTRSATTTCASSPVSAATSTTSGATTSTACTRRTTAPTSTTTT